MSALAEVLPDSGYDSPDLGVGFDTVAVKGRTSMGNMLELDRVWSQQSVDRQTGEVAQTRPGGDTQVLLGAATAKVKLFTAPDGAAVMKVEASLPRVLLGHNWDGIPVADLDDAVDELLFRLADHFDDVPRVEDVRLTRLDLTRDFLNVRNPSATLTAIAAHPARRATTHEKFRRNGHELQTLIHGSGRYWLARAYDKVYEQRQRSAPPADRTTQLRFELQLRSKILPNLGLTTVPALMSHDLTALTKKYFERCNYEVNTAMNNADEVFARLRDEGISDAKLKNVQSYLFALEHNCSPMMGKNAFQEARALVNRHKLSPATLGATTFVRRLDFDSGWEVTE
jgi:hypothetical protein